MTLTVLLIGMAVIFTALGGILCSLRVDRLEKRVEELER
jgi:hypothetical protein